MASNLLQLLLDLDDPAPNPSSIHLQLRLAGAPGPNAPSQPGQLAPMAGEAREQILELGQLDLELPLPRSGALGENIQNEPGPINHLSAKGGFEISLLGTGQVIVEDDKIHALLPPPSPGPIGVRGWGRNRSGRTRGVGVAPAEIAS